ncbi:MAG: hypothetical protein PWP23_2410 [Candidatus Sumerlaeota bacterium]|nr:hypothetical protein [Candidatus Sumerlaeota bacterium]
MSRLAPKLLESIALERITPLLGESGVPQFALPTRGNNSEVYLLSYPSGTGAVLRAFTDRHEYRRYRRAMSWASRHDAPVPRLLGCWGSPACIRRWGRLFCLEEFVDGPLAEECDLGDPAVQGAILDAAARLHDKIVPADGVWTRLRYHPPRQPYLLARALKYLAEIPPSSPVFSPAERQHIECRLAESAAAIPRQKVFSLVHHHLAADDIALWRDGRGAVVLDNGGLRFGHWGHDLEDVLAFLDGNDVEQRRRLIALYLERRTTLPASFPYEPMETFFQADRHLKKLRSWVRKLGPDPGAPLSEQVETHRSALLRLLA